MKPNDLLCCLLALPLGAALAHATATKPIASYELTARLDPKAKAIEGGEILTWLNDSPDEIRELQFHLYMNAFKNEKTTFLRESGGASRGYPIEKDGWGWIDVKRLQVEGGPDLTRAIRFIQPDDGNPDDQTVIAVPLPAPVKPGGTIRLAIDFYTKLPKVFARTGYRRDFYMVAQWFPKIGVWEKAGERYAAKGGWNCHQFHAMSEFYADYGAYRAALTVPSNYVVGATGVLEERHENPGAGTTTYRFVEQDVHDFAWTASPVYQRIERRFVADREAGAREVAAMAKLLGLPESHVRLTDVQMILLIQPEHAAQIERHFKAVTNALKYYGLWYGAYPYRTITIVDPPYGAGGAGGMEYPTLFTAGTSWWVGDDEPGPEAVIIHEFGHQYWYGMVGSNEFEEAWLDEGINSYSTTRVLAAAYPAPRFPIDLAGIPMGGWLGAPTLNWNTLDRAGYLALPKDDIVVRNAWEFYDAASYAVNSYPRSAVTLQTLERRLGTPAMSRVMRAYFQRWKYRHPTTRDFIQVVNEVSGKDMQWFFDQFLFGSNILDYRVGSVECSKAGARRGVFDTPKGRITIDAREAERLDRQSEQKKQPESYECEVKIQREGEAVFPVQVRVRFKNGETIERSWDGKYRWAKFRFTRPSAIESVAVDPGYNILLDANFANNSHTEAVAWKPIVKWSENLLFWVQNLLWAVSAVS
jgi:hypothetical protein